MNMRLRPDAHAAAEKRLEMEAQLAEMTNAAAPELTPNVCLSRCHSHASLIRWRV